MSILFGITLLFVFFGIAIKYFKWYFLISGYNMMSKKQKENVDIKSLGNLIGNYMFLIASIVGISGYMQNLGYKNISLSIMLSMIPLIIILLIKAQKYDYNKQNSKDRKIKYTVAIGIILLTLIITSGFLIVGIIEPKVDISSDKIMISGLYKRTIKVSNIKEITLEDTIPRVLRKTNGFDFGYTLRGNFELEGEGISSIYIQENQSPYIVIKTDKRLVILNYKDPARTQSLYNDLESLYPLLVD